MQLHNFILGHVLPATILNPRPLGMPNVVRQWNSLKVGVSRSYAEQFACCILPLPQCQTREMFWKMRPVPRTIHCGHGFASRLDVCKLHLKSEKRDSQARASRIGSELAVNQLVNTKTCLLNLSFPLTPYSPKDWKKCLT